MAFRGRGRGRGGGGGFGARQQKFELFPELHDEQSLPKASSVKEEKALMLWSHRLQTFWNSSVYYLEDKGIKKEESLDIERFSDRGKKRTLPKDKLSDFIKCTIEYVPAELARDLKSVRLGQKKVRWNQDSGLKKFDLFEKLEEKVQSNGKGGKGEEDVENEEEDDEIIEEEEEDFSDDDYNQNVDFDDDEDDFNMPEDNDDEGGLY